MLDQHNSINAHSLIKLAHPYQNHFGRVFFLRLKKVGIDRRLPCRPSSPGGAAVYASSGNVREAQVHRWVDKLKQTLCRGFVHALQNTLPVGLNVLQSRARVGWCEKWENGFGGRGVDGCCGPSSPGLFRCFHRWRSFERYANILKYRKIQ